MGQTSKTLLTALIISLFSLSAIQGVKIITNNSSKVLGETVIAPIVQGVPCATINSWQQRYCSNVGPTGPVIIPTAIPIPTTITCKTGYGSFSVGPICKSDSTRYITARYTCYDNYSGTVGDSSGINCYTLNQLQSMATSACSGRTSCSKTTPTPSPIPTSKPLPTPTPTSTFINPDSTTCLPGNRFSARLSGQIVLQDPSSTGYYVQYVDITSNNKVTNLYAAAKPGIPSPLYLSPSGTVYDRLGKPPIDLISDGRLYAIDIYEGTYSPTEDKFTRQIASFFYLSKNCTSPTPTAAPTSAPQTKTINLIPQGTFSANATGKLTYDVVKVATNYADFKFSNISFTGLLPTTNYQLHICDATNNCSSSAQLNFISDTSGNYYSSNTLVIGSVNTVNIVKDFRLYQPLAAGPVPTSSTKTCFMYSTTATSCLRAYFSI